jgi:energy-coupling factor transport system ATP-binding protein
MRSFETSETIRKRSDSPQSGGKLYQDAIQCSVKELTVSFYDSPDRKVLNGIDLQIEKGESVLLLGPSGSGKSTLGYVWGGLIPRSIEATVTGEVKVNGRAGMLFQDPEAQFCMLTAEDEIAFGLENLRLPREAMPARIDAVLERFGLLDWKSQNTVEMSGGMKQKLALACLLAMEPDFYIFDEPTANLDPVATKDVLQEIRLLRQKENKTVVIIEHKVEGVVEWVDRVVLLGPDGRLLDDGVPLEIFRRRQKEIRQYGIWQPTLWKWAVRFAEASTRFPDTAGALIEMADPARLPELTVVLEEETGLSDSSGDLSQDAQTVHGEQGIQPLFEARNAGFGYGTGRYVWKSVSFEIQEGEWVAIAGPNGCGKSTLLAALMGLRTLTEGELFLNGQPLLSYTGKELSRKLGFVFQNPEHQFVTDTVWQEVAFGVEGKDAKERVRAVLADLGLLHVAKASPFSLSQGEKRRLSVATTLLTPHSALLLDEPTFGQDAFTARELEEKLASRHRQGGTIIMVTHDMELVARRAQKVLVLADGTLIFAGTPQQLFRNEPVLRQANLERPAAVEVLDALRRKAGDVCAVSAANQSIV